MAPIVANLNNQKVSLNSAFQVMKAFAEAENEKKGQPESLFEDVYKEMPPHIAKQMNEMKQHVKQYKEHYPLEHFQPMS